MNKLNALKSVPAIQNNQTGEFECIGHGATRDAVLDLNAEYVAYQLRCGRSVPGPFVLTNVWM